MEFDDILVYVDHPMVEGYLPLPLWVKNGPGGRKYVTITHAKHRVTGEILPMSVVPLKYRNNRLSRLLIRLGFLENPWPK
jgi:hypothetical protein